MFSRSPARGGSNQQSSASRRQDREIRKLRGELQHETQKFQNMVKKYQKELEDVTTVSDDVMMMSFSESGHLTVQDTVLCNVLIKLLSSPENCRGAAAAAGSSGEAVTK